MPYDPYFSTDDDGHKYKISTFFEHLVHEYSGLSFFEINQLEYVDWLILRRDAFIHAMNQTEKGREYLDKAWILEQTEQDRSALREHFGAKRKEGEAASGK